MENSKIPPTHFSPSPENPSVTTFRRRQTTENLYSSDQAIESAFSRLTLQPETASFQSFHPAINAMPSAQSALLWAQAQNNNNLNNNNNNNNGFVSGPFGAHNNINVGPLKSPYQQNPMNMLMMKYQNHHQRLNLYDDYDYYEQQFLNLHDKQTNFPILPPPQKGVRNYNVANMRGKIGMLAKDQMWCDLLILKMEKGLILEEEIEMLLSEVSECLDDVMRNQFGSYFVQKLFVLCNEDQRTRIVVALTKYPFKLINTCLTSYGARVVPKLLEKLVTPQQIYLIMSAISIGAVTLATDTNGYHVLQFCVKNFPGEYNKKLYAEIANNCFRIATNKSGCCVLQACVESSSGEDRRLLISEIIANALHLSEDPYGNYVVQHLLGLGMQEVTKSLVRRFQGHFAHLSFNKYASNVVEKFISESGEQISAIIIMELLTGRNVATLLVHPYGNFVIQSALSASKGDVHEALLKLIRNNAPFIQSNLYGKRILAWFEKRKLNIV